jgi:hypothetical protein
VPLDAVINKLPVFIIRNPAGFALLPVAINGLLVVAVTRTVREYVALIFDELYVAAGAE